MCCGSPGLNTTDPSKLLSFLSQVLVRRGHSVGHTLSSVAQTWPCKLGLPESSSAGLNFINTTPLLFFYGNIELALLSTGTYMKSKQYCSCIPPSAEIKQSKPNTVMQSFCPHQVEQMLCFTPPYFTESHRLENTFQIESNLWPNTTLPTQPWH